MDPLIYRIRTLIYWRLLETLKFILRFLECYDDVSLFSTNSRDSYSCVLIVPLVQLNTVPQMTDCTCSIVRSTTDLSVLTYTLASKLVFGILLGIVQQVNYVVIFLRSLS